MNKRFLKLQSSESKSGKNTGKELPDRCDNSDDRAINEILSKRCFVPRLDVVTHCRTLGIDWWNGNRFRCRFK